MCAPESVVSQCVHICAGVGVEMDQQLLSIIITITATTAAAAAINRHNYLIDVIEEGKLGSQVESQLAGWSCHPEKKYRQKVVDVGDWTELQEGVVCKAIKFHQSVEMEREKSKLVRAFFPFCFCIFQLTR